ncbi:MAG: response regulator transcription factor [Gammaproteobacteria bacterium]
MIAAGQANKEIARRLGISKFTVGAHLARVFAKLGVHSRVTLAARLMRRINLP